jgi:type IV pilus assembly protein PilC
LKNIYIARFSENLSTLIQSGLPITTALLITSDVVGNESYRQIIREGSGEIKKGGGMAEIFEQYELIPPIVSQMIKVGEETGRIDFTLGKITDFYMKEADNMVRNFSTLIEPVIMVILAIGVGILVSAVLLPIYQVATSIK